jgi:hypothetical protein
MFASAHVAPALRWTAESPHPRGHATGSVVAAMGHESRKLSRHATALRDKWKVPLNKLTPMNVQEFTRAPRARLLDMPPGFGKTYLNLLVDEIRLDGSELHVKGSYRALARSVSLSKEGKLGNVPSCVPEWRARQDS